MHHFWFFPGFLFFLLFFGFFISNMIMWRKRGRMCHSGSFNALDMLEKRYVSGEIDEVEFRKIRENLKK